MLLVCFRVLLVCFRVLLVCFRVLLVCFRVLLVCFGVLLVCFGVLLVCFGVLLVCFGVFCSKARDTHHLSHYSHAVPKCLIINLFRLIITGKYQTSFYDPVTFRKI